MELEPVQTPHAPAAIGPYSQAVRTGDWLFVSGQIPLDPATGRLVEGGVEAQAERALRNLQAVVEAGGGRLENVVKVTLFLTDLGQFEAVNGVYARFFTHKPARAAVGVAALPRGAAVEVEAVARL
ncbi:RidA family protein [Limnochorda pilosa]|uniref:Endoribonuclease n=1 Tax=Limnochorda pilosa TaxID=1555112 RepID=A0A0K2SMY0_LIMPI|nr:RidA family protein [Limnochorda pilosa]BAS28362.1 endoribonuclease [Limnochorda pilosa]